MLVTAGLTIALAATDRACGREVTCVATLSAKLTQTVQVFAALAATHRMQAARVPAETEPADHTAAATTGE